MTGSAGAWGRRSSRTLPVSSSLRTSPCHLLQGEHLRAHETPSRHHQRLALGIIMSRKVVAKTAWYLDDKGCQRPADVSWGSDRQGTVQRKSVPGSEHCADALPARHASAQSTKFQSLVAKDERSRSGLTTPSFAGAPRAQHAHALECDLSMLAGGVSYCRFSFHGGVKHVPATGHR